MDWFIYTQEPSVFQKLTVEDNVRAIVETLSLTKRIKILWYKKG